MSWRTLKSFVYSSALVFAALAGASTARSQVVFHGRVQGRVTVSPLGSARRDVPLSTILAIASLPGSDSEALSFRTWEMEPVGWFRLSGGPGCYTLVFSGPAHFMRPQVLTNQFTADGDSLDLQVRAAFDFSCFQETTWDPEPAQRYWQQFVARGTAVTAAGFKLATDGVDGPGPGSQDVLVSVHRPDDGPPEQWPQVGPAGRVVGVDCGGAKSYWYSVGWNSGEVPTTAGETYAVSIRPADPSRTFQAFWRATEAGRAGCYRLGRDSRGHQGRDLWLAVSSDGDGLLIPYNKRVHRKFGQLTRFGRKWSQTYVARGRGLASVILYAAVSGTQPPLSRQRVKVRVRARGPQGSLVGREKIAVGNGNYTGDASWGHFVTAFAPGEVLLEPGETYAVEFESIETPRTIGGFVNIKGEKSDGRVGFNPYRKCPPDDYPHGDAYYLGTERVDYDLDMQLIEYEYPRPRWEDAEEPPDLLANGSMEEVATDEKSLTTARPRGWTPFTVAAGTAHRWVKEGTHGGRCLQLGAVPGGESSDGGWVQRVEQLSVTETYRLRGRLRATWPSSVERAGQVGFDPTGQTVDPDARTIEWTPLPRVHGVFVDYRSRPIRPREGAISVWLRARSKKEDERFPFRVDFDDFSLRRVATGVPDLRAETSGGRRSR